MRFTLNGLLRRSIALLPPRLGLRCLRALETARGNIEPDILHLPNALPRRRTVVDVGANEGITLSVFATRFARVEAFEPNPGLTRRVEPALPANVRLHTVALSSAQGEAELRVPVDAGVLLEGWASLDRPQIGDESTWRVVRVPTRTLDSFGLDEVDLIKIDVEGHELSVLAGARDTILRHRPWLIVEVWDESRPEVIRTMSDLAYHVASLKDLCGVEGAPNNLIFLPD